MTMSGRKVPRFVQTRDGAMELLKDEIAAVNRADAIGGIVITDAYRLSSAKLHSLVSEAARGHHWRLREGAAFPKFDSARAISLTEALDFFEF